MKWVSSKVTVCGHEKSCENSLAAQVYVEQRANYVHSCTFTRLVSLSLYWPYVRRPLSIAFLPLVLTSPRIRSKVSQEKGGEGGSRGGGWQGVSCVFPACCVSSQVSLYVLVLVLSSKASHFSQSEQEKAEGEETRGEGCFSLTHLPGRVGALTCNASWVINPSRWMHHWFTAWISIEVHWQSSVIR